MLCTICHGYLKVIDGKQMNCDMKKIIKTKQNKTKQNKTKQNKTKQNKQNKTKQNQETKQHKQRHDFGAFYVFF